MRRIAPVVAIMLLLSLALPTQAHFGFLVRQRPTVAYYYAVPVVPVPLYVTPTPVVCIPIAPPRPVAQPQPAPPSPGREPPLAEPGRPLPQPAPTPPPGSQPRESRYFDTYAVAPGASAQTKSPRCSVSFWNLSGQEFVLKVGNQRVTLDRGRNATLELEREFTWQIEGRETESGRVAANESALEIVIRR